MPRRFFSLRIRMVGLVALMLVPWLVLVVYTQADEREAAIVSVHGDEMRLIRIVTSNQAAQIEAAHQLLTAFALCSANTRSGHCGRQQVFVMQATQQRSDAQHEALADPMAG
jgi:hypothetical protein